MMKLKQSRRCRDSPSAISRANLSAEMAITSDMFPDSRSDFELIAMLEIIGSQACESQRVVCSSRVSQMVLECHNLLLSWYSKYRQATITYQLQTSSLMMLWHSNFMLLNMNVDDLERACGRDGRIVAEKRRQKVEAWARSEQGRRCIIHAILVQRQFENIPLGKEPPIHAPSCLYRCGIVWYCYTHFGGGGWRDEQTFNSLDLPELQALNLDGKQILMEELVCRNDGGLTSSPLFRIIDLLHRISHWKVAQSLAATLLALSEENHAGL